MDAELPVRPLEWVGGEVRILDQRRLPRAERYLIARTPDDMAEAIRTLAVRGAPLLGIAAGYGMALAAVRSQASTVRGVVEEMQGAGRVLVASRPTAVNIAWAVDRVLHRAAASVNGDLDAANTDAVRASAVEESLAIAREDDAACRAIGLLGSDLVPGRANVLTHCNTGALATGGPGTALGVISAAHLAGKEIHVWVPETRPVLQGARLTAWELQRLGIPMTLVADTAPGSLIARGKVDLVIVGADRIAANGDVANKVGTYQLAVLAARHRIPFYVAAPVSTIDLSTATGARIEIEDRDPAEVTSPLGVPFAPEGTPAANPAFDVTPASLVRAIVTDRGIARPPFRSSLRSLTRRPGDAGRSRGGRSARPAAVSGGSAHRREA
jgi:methylthioribose-1-phosphate isomerase